MRVKKTLANTIFPGILQFLVYTGTARAQDPFEIDVYEYEQLAPGGLTLEGHFNFVGIGTDSFEGPVAPTNHPSALT